MQKHDFVINNSSFWAKNIQKWFLLVFIRIAESFDSGMMNTIFILLWIKSQSYFQFELNAYAMKKNE